MCSCDSHMNIDIFVVSFILQELVYHDGALVAGSLDALIDLLIPTPAHYPDRKYMFAFILCSRLFVQPYELLAQVSCVS